VIWLLFTTNQFGHNDQMDFPQGHAIFTCSTKMNTHQSIEIAGTHGRLNIETPWSKGPDSTSEIEVISSLDGSPAHETFTFAPCNQWGHMCDLFCKSVREGLPAPVPLKDSVANLKVLDAIFTSSRTGAWATL
jgi:predicted dehydrogenase